ncbi:MAG TPA: protein YgfX [Fontimonas sp.]
MTGEFGTTLDLTLKPSVRAVLWAYGLHVLCLILLLLAQPPTSVMIGFAVAFGLSWFTLRRHPAFGYGPKALQRIVWHADGSWTLHRGSGQTAEAQLDPGSIVRGPLLLLRFRIEGAPRTARLITGDETDAEALRQLRARLSVA